MSVTIIGAGLSGLLAGCLFPGAKIFEAGPREQCQHKAVLRFRSRAVGDAVGVEFRAVRVNKGIWSEGGFVEPNIRLANLYSRKVLGGKLADRSIWNLAPVERFIAPENFTELLVQRCEGQGEIFWDANVNSLDENSKDPVLSTIPMSALAKLLGTPVPDEIQFKSSPITVNRFRVEGADVFQTVYFPDAHMGVYRASITGDLLIVESISDSGGADFSEIVGAFGLSPLDVQRLDSAKQSYGKIAPIDDAWRRRFIAATTRDHNVYSVGRFGLWKNVLMDDVLQDINVVKKLIGGDLYAHSKKAF